MRARVRVRVRVRARVRVRVGVRARARVRVRVSEEVHLGEPLGVVDAHVAVRFEGGAYEAGEHIELLLRMRHAHEVGLLLDVPG